jgi:hypothetical protein
VKSENSAPKKEKPTVSTFGVKRKGLSEKHPSIVKTFFYKKKAASLSTFNKYFCKNKLYFHENFTII